MIIKGLRSEKIIIEMYNSGDDPWIHIRVQDIEIDDTDGSVVSATPARRMVSRRFSAVASDSVTATDPVTQAALSASVGGVSELIRQAAIQWFNEDFGTVKNSSLNKAVFP